MVLSRTINLQTETLPTFPPDGFRFAGVIKSVRYSAFGPGVSGGVGSESTQIFRSDGNYTDSSFTGAFGAFDTGGDFTATSEQPEQFVHYEVTNGLITLTPPKGEHQTTWIIIEGEDSVIIRDSRYRHHTMSS